MEQRLLFVADYIRGGVSMSELCRRYGISRKCGYKWVERYREQGLDGLEERSRRPHGHPARTPYAVREAIMAIRRRYRPPPGPKKIAKLLACEHEHWAVPSQTTIYTILKEAGLIAPRRPRRRVAGAKAPASPPDRPNELWSVDFKGQFRLGDGCWCYPLTVMDHSSRYLLACRGFAGTRYAPTQAAFRELFRTYGLPRRIRSDNGVPFASRSIGGLSRLSVWWVRLGIVPERIEPGKPQQNGRHERMHRTLKQAATQPVAANRAAQQRCLERFRRQYNDERPHEALGQCTPASRYQCSPRPLPRRLPTLTYPAHFTVAPVSANGIVYRGADRIYIGYLLGGESVGMEQIDESVWRVYFGPLILGSFDKRRRNKAGDDYHSLNV